MSLRVLTMVWDRFPEGGSKLLTMLALADWSNDDGGRVYPRIDTLAAKIRMSERQTLRIMQDLAGALWITNLTPGNIGGRGQFKRYEINLETLTNCPVLTPRKRVTSATVKGDKCDINHDTVSPESAPAPRNARQPSLKPLLNRETVEKIRALKGYLDTLHRLANPDALTTEEIDRATAQIVVLEAELNQGQAALEL